MKKLNYSEILDILRDITTVSSFCDEFPDYIDVPEELGEVEEIDSYGGEDCGSTYYSIKHFKDHDVYIKVSGWYQSHYGTDFGDWDSACEEVKPKTKTITVYE